MEQDIAARLDALEEKIDRVYSSVEKIRLYFKWTLIITVLAVVLPIIGLAFAIPAFLTSYVGQLSGMEGLLQ